ncbi:hypothetical protein [Janibacter melonis]|uniref:hypothetical protein n=1 Tax=Janibacter melonis TaxID=262209 RepID=UPI0035588D25
MVRKIKAKLVLRLRSEGLTGRQIAAQGMSRTSVAMVLDAADGEGIGWDDVAAFDEADVHARLFPGRGEHDSVHAQPDWEKVPLDRDRRRQHARTDRRVQLSRRR